MPYVFAHPAVALPLYGCMGRFGILSALVIGTLVPDLWYLAPSFLNRDASHSGPGLLLFCLPVGMCLYVLFHRLLKQPLLALLRRPPVANLDNQVETTGQKPSRLAVPVSLMAGSASHILWDAFTHEDGFVVESLAYLRLRLATFGDYELFAYSALQHLSTALGVAVVVFWLRRHFRITIAATVDRRWLAGIAVAAAISFLAAGLRAAFDGNLPAIRDLAREVFSLGLQSFAVSLLVYALLWHLRMLYRSRKQNV